MRHFLFVLLTITSLNASAKQWDQWTRELTPLEVDFDISDTTYVKPPTEYPVTFNETDFDTKPWMREFEWVIVVNKATTGADRQSVRIYRNQVLQSLMDITADSTAANDGMDWHLNDLTKRLWSPTIFKVSTGREAFEAKGEHGSQNDSYTITPSGYFVPQSFTKKHKSEAYSGVNCGGEPTYVYSRRWVGSYPFQRVETVTKLVKPVKCVYMEDVIFFNGGIALHRAISGTEPVLGNKASGGCVRLPGAVANYLYNNIKDAKTSVGLPQVKQDGTVVTDKAGNIVRVMKNKSNWGTLEARSALIIVHSTVVEQVIPIPTPRPQYP